MKRFLAFLCVVLLLASSASACDVGQFRAQCGIGQAAFIQPFVGYSAAVVQQPVYVQQFAVPVYSQQFVGFNGGYGGFSGFRSRGFNRGFRSFGFSRFGGGFGGGGNQFGLFNFRGN